MDLGLFVPQWLFLLTLGPPGQVLGSVARYAVMDGVHGIVRLMADQEMRFLRLNREGGLS